MSSASMSLEYGAEGAKSSPHGYYIHEGDHVSLKFVTNTFSNRKCDLPLKPRLGSRSRRGRITCYCATLTTAFLLAFFLLLLWAGELQRIDGSVPHPPPASAFGVSIPTGQVTSQRSEHLGRPVAIQSHLELLTGEGKYLEAWVALGEVLEGLDLGAHTRLDGLWNWVNGSDPRHRLGRDFFAQDPTRATRSPSPLSNGRQLNFVSAEDPEASIVKPATVFSVPSGSDIRLQNSDARFIEHDELRYSLRSAKVSLGEWLRTSHVISTDFWPFGMPEELDQAYETKTQSDDMTGLALLKSRFTRRSILTRSKRHEVNVGQSDVFHIEGGLVRYGQLPQWLDVNSPHVRVGDRARIIEQGTAPSLRIHHDWSCFSHLRDIETVSQALPKEPSEEAMLDYKLQVLPTFNSMAAESGLGLNVTDLSEVFFYSNDDNFMDAPMTTADFASPLYGPVFHINHVYPLDPEEHPKNELGEHPSLKFSAWMLDERFGPRTRYYVIHVQKAHILPLLRESRLMWGSEFGRTQAKRFRGDGRATNSHLLSYNFIIERHREALLWSYFVSRLDVDGDGQYSSEELQRAWRDLGLASLMDEHNMTNLWQGTLISKVAVPVRDTLLKSQVKQNLEQAHFPTPKQSTYQFSSHDGYALSPIAFPSSPESQWPIFHQELGEGTQIPERAAAWIDWSFCWPEGVATDPVGLFKHMAFVATDCGDFLITLLTNKSGRKGMSAFLPHRQTTFPVAVSSVHRNATTPHLPLNSRWEDADFSLRAVARNTGWSAQSRRTFAMLLIQRYSYTISAGPVAFEMLTGPETASAAFTKLRDARLTSGGTALIGINDDVAMSPEETFNMFREWMEWSWPTSTAALPYEWQATVNTI